MAKLSGFLTPIIGEEGLRELDESGVGKSTMVMCKQRSASVPDGPECADVARAYGLGLENESQSPIMVVVQGSSAKLRYCSGLYGPDGSFLGELD